MYINYQDKKIRLSFCCFLFLWEELGLKLQLEVIDIDINISYFVVVVVVDR